MCLQLNLTCCAQLLQGAALMWKRVGKLFEKIIKNEGKLRKATEYVGPNLLTPEALTQWPKGAYRALCARCAKSWLFSTTGSSVSSED